MLQSLIYMAIGLLGIGFVIFLHEFGHFIASKAMGIDVEVLSYGFGPRLLSFYSHDTEFRLSLIPFGGYCRMKGSMDLMKALRDNSSSFDRTEHGSYFGTTPVRKLVIYLAGPLMNLVLAVLILTLSAMIPVERISDPAVVTPISLYPSLFPDSPKQPGIEKGDRIISSGNTVFSDWQSVEEFLSARQGEEVPMKVQRDGALIETNLIPLDIDGRKSFGISVLIEPVIGRSLSEDFIPGDRIIEADGKRIENQLDLYSVESSSFPVIIERDGEHLSRMIEERNLPFAWESGIRVSRNPGSPLLYGIQRSFDIGVSAMKALGALLSFHLSDALSVLTGPMKAAENIGGITVLAFSESAGSGIRSLFQLLAAVSVSIAAGNLLPIPTFDGGQVLICLSEVIMGKELTPRSYIVLQIIGMILAVLIMLLMYSLDIKAYLF